jgi:hypothetical protein
MNKHSEPVAVLRLREALKALERTGVTPAAMENIALLWEVAQEQATPAVQEELEQALADANQKLDTKSELEKLISKIETAAPSLLSRRLKERVEAVAGLKQQLDLHQRQKSLFRTDLKLLGERLRNAVDSHSPVVYLQLVAAVKSRLKPGMKREDLQPVGSKLRELHDIMTQKHREDLLDLLFAAEHAGRVYGLIRARKPQQEVAKELREFRKRHGGMGLFGEVFGPHEKRFNEFVEGKA